MQNITLKPIKAQEVNVKLGGQNVLLRIVQRTTGLYMDIALEKVWIAQGVPCLNCNKIVRYPYLGFRGEIFLLIQKEA